MGTLIFFHFGLGLIEGKHDFFFFLVLRWTAPNRAMVDDAVYGSQNNAIPVLIVWDCLPIYFFFGTTVDGPGLGRRAGRGPVPRASENDRDCLFLKKLRFTLKMMGLFISKFVQGADRKKSSFCEKKHSFFEVGLDCRDFDFFPCWVRLNRGKT